MGWWVRARACAQTRAWHTQGFQRGAEPEARRLSILKSRHRDIDRQCDTRSRAFSFVYRHLTHNTCSNNSTPDGTLLSLLKAHTSDTHAHTHTRITHTTNHQAHTKGKAPAEQVWDRGRTPAQRTRVERSGRAARCAARMLKAPCVPPCTYTIRLCPCTHHPPAEGAVLGVPCRSSPKALRLGPSRPRSGPNPGPRRRRASQDAMGDTCLAHAWHAYRRAPSKSRRLLTAEAAALEPPVRASAYRQLGLDLAQVSEQQVKWCVGQLK